ncbi:hypothetical protein [Bradyrhizobium sp. LMTR 3]|uniref:hypothetical protein n=1 Tax=Bradyrhizobium sp. LMTR 3 TaxID=189873 RepID=UPI0008108567|nr:hypothetical protein [Bradyrhizobium sp. LMTR 3]OCK54837.1 hypothetical protein LMTR3_08520 [Bradyrhizobium sp. LMTR 3]
MLYALLALMAPLWSRSRDRTAAQCKAPDTSVSRLLVFAATVLFVILSILIVDLYRDELHALGLVGGVERIDAIFMSP